MSNSATQQEKRFCYIYKTTQISTEKIYVGKHTPKKPEFDKNYFGSGNFIKNYIKSKGSARGLKCEIVKDENGNDVCGYFTNEELNELEIKYIALYREKYNTLCMNFADGGSGGSSGMGIFISNGEKNIIIIELKNKQIIIINEYQMV